MYERAESSNMLMRGCKWIHSNAGKVKMFAKKYILWLCIFGLVETSCTSMVAPTVQPVSTVVSVRQEPTATAFIGMPEISNPLMHTDDEGLEEFVARIAGRKISYSRPALIALTQAENENDLYFGISSELRDIQRCWFYETNSMRACSDEDMTTYFRDQATPRILFAPVYSDSVKFLFLIEHVYYWDGNKSTEWYRLILERKDGVWVEKYILPFFW